MATNLKKELRDQIEGQNEEYKEVIIQKESRKFVEIFDRVFSESDDTDNTEDAVDGIVEDILNAIISRVKAIIKQKFVKEIIQGEEEEDGEDESSSETEA